MRKFYSQSALLDVLGLKCKGERDSVHPGLEKGKLRKESRRIERARKQKIKRSSITKQLSWESKTENVCHRVRETTMAFQLVRRHIFLDKM